MPANRDLLGVLGATGLLDTEEVGLRVAGDDSGESDFRVGSGTVLDSFTSSSELGGTGTFGFEVTRGSEREASRSRAVDFDG